MARTDQELLQAFMFTLETDLKRKHNELGQKASGFTESRIRSRVDGLTGFLLAPQHIEALESGRGPTQNNGGGGGLSLQKRILNWINIKGISPQGGISKESLSWAITTKIHKEGTRLFREGRRSGLLSDVITRPRIEAFLGAFAEARASTIESQLAKLFR